MKSVLVIAIVAVVMIGVMAPSVFAETVSNNIGTATIDEKQYHIDRWGYCNITIYGFIEIVEGIGSLAHYYPDGSTGYTWTFLAAKDGSFTVNNFLNCDSDSSILVSYGDNEIGILNYSASDYRQYLEDQKELKRGEYKLQEQQNQFFTKVTEKPIDLKKLGIASFVDQSKDPQHYIDRYNNEPTYKEWFDENYSQYISIYQAVGVKEPILNYLEKPIVEVLPTLNCGTGTVEKNGICVVETKVVEKKLVKLETNSKVESKENFQGFCIILMMLIVPGIMIVLYVIILWKMNSNYISRVFVALILFGIFFVIWIALVFGVLSSCM